MIIHKLRKNRNLHFAKREASIVITSQQLRRVDSLELFRFSSCTPG